MKKWHDFGVTCLLLATMAYAPGGKGTEVMQVQVRVKSAACEVE